MRHGWAAAAAAAAATVLAEVAFRHSAHPTFLWHSLPAFDLVYGFAGCVLIVLASKALGRAFLQKPESFYGEDE